MKSCSNCQHSVLGFSDVESEGPLLKCHRYPPTLLVVAGEIAQAFPDAYEVCGEHSEQAPPTETP